MTANKETLFHIVNDIIGAYALLGVQKAVNLILRLPLFCAFAARNPLGEDNYVILAENPKETALMIYEHMLALQQGKPPPKIEFDTLEEAQQAADAFNIRALQTYLSLNAENN